MKMPLNGRYKPIFKKVFFPIFIKFKKLNFSTFNRTYNELEEIKIKS
jgi:hypothetical protein